MERLTDEDGPLTPHAAASVVLLVLAASVLVPGTGATAPAVNSTDADTEMRLSRTDRSTARRWSLTATEWRRYQHLMAGLRGAISEPNISPIEVLGIHARSEGERRRYAERWAMLMHEDAERVLTFERAYRAAFARRYPHASAVDVLTLGATRKASAGPESLMLGDRLLVFVPRECVQRCQGVVAGLLRRIQLVPGVSLDIYVRDARTRRAVDAWARTQRIEPSLVTQRRVTLNRDNGRMAQLHKGAGASASTIPWVVRQRGNRLVHIANPQRWAL